MKISNLNPRSILSVWLTFLFIPSTGHAELYKWVDEKGQIHYTEKREESRYAKEIELKVISPQTSTQETNSSPQTWQEKERQFQERRAQRQAEELRKPPVDTRPKSLSGGVTGEVPGGIFGLGKSPAGLSHDTNEWKCLLAKDVLSGAVKHRNGAPTSDYDRTVAQREIEEFCR